jgi:hypothetical protein
MAEGCYMARAMTKQQVLNGVNKLTLQTNEHDQYMHNAILLMQKGIWCVLISQFNPSDLGKGLEKLLNDGNNLLTLVKSTYAITAGLVIKAAKKRADKLTTTTGKTVLPSITAQTEAQEEADQLNVINQLVIGAEEGVGKAITKSVGSNGSNNKSIDEFTLYKVMKVAIDSTDRLSINGVLEQLIEVINHTFNFCKKVSINMELMQSNTAEMATYGIIIGIPQLMLTLLANIETANQSDYGCKFCSAMQAIRKKHTCNHMHDAALLQIILKELVGADDVRVLKDAPALDAGRNHAFGCQIGHLPPSDDGREHQLRVHRIGIRREFRQQFFQRRTQAMGTQLQKIPTFQVVWWTRKTEEGQG